MPIALDPNAEYRIVAANAHYYKTPAPERSIDRVLPYHDFIYLLEGQWAITEGEMEYQLEKGDVLLLRAGMHHYTSKPCLAGTRTYCIHIEQVPAQGDAPDEDALLPTRLHTDDANVRRYFESIVNAYWSEGVKYKEEKLSALTRILVLELLSMYHLQCEDTRGIADHAIDMIISAPHHCFSNSEVAAALFISSKTLNNAMNQKTGMPFHAYQINLKLEMIAKQLEMEPDLLLIELAHAYGFYDEFHMSKAFKKKYGISPQQYRGKFLRVYLKKEEATARADFSSVQGGKPKV